MLVLDASFYHHRKLLDWIARPMQIIFEKDRDAFVPCPVDDTVNPLWFGPKIRLGLCPDDDPVKTG